MPKPKEPTIEISPDAKASQEEATLLSTKPSRCWHIL
jgi:hypothetical protein